MLNSLHFKGFIFWNDRNLAAAETRDEYEMPLYIDVDNYDDYNYLLGCDCVIDICGTGRNIEIYDSEEAYRASSPALAPIALIPTGTFSIDPDDDYDPNPSVLFSGTVEDIEYSEESSEDEPNCRLQIRTLGITFDLFICHDKGIQIGSVVHGEAWLYGSIENFTYNEEAFQAEWQEAVSAEDAEKMYDCADFLLWASEKSESEIDPRLMLECYTMAADAGSKDACFYAGLYYQEGWGTEQDFELAMKYYKMGAAADEACCMNQIGVLYGRGLGVTQNAHKASEYYLKAGEHGEPVGYRNIGVFYDTGELGEVDPKKAAEYYEKAAELGDSESDRRLKELKEEGLI